METTNTTPATRDHRIDWLRGMALVMIFINHMPGNWLENWTSRNYGFSDAAEVFVLLAGVAAAYAYFRPFSGANRIVAVRKVFARTWMLYLAHLGSTFSALALFAAAAWAFANPDVLDLIGVAPVFSDPYPGLFGIMIGGLQLGYFNILPMYVVILLLTPALMWLAVRDLRLMLAASVAVYLAAQIYGLAMPNYPEDGGWYFNPFAWQLLFAVGMALGILRLRAQSVPYHPLAYAAALAYVLFGAIWVLNDWVGNIGFGVLPDFVATLAKSKLPLARLVHVLALAYVLVYSPLWRWMATIPAENILSRMGRNSLPVFCLGSILSMVGYIALIATGGGYVLETILVSGGVALMASLAIVMETGMPAASTSLGWAKASARRVPIPHDEVTPPTVATGRRR